MSRLYDPKNDVDQLFAALDRLSEFHSRRPVLSRFASADDLAWIEKKLLRDIRQRAYHAHFGSWPPLSWLDACEPLPPSRVKILPPIEKTQ